MTDHQHDQPAPAEGEGAPPQGFVVDGPGVGDMLAAFAALHTVTVGTRVDYVDVAADAAVAVNVPAGAAVTATVDRDGPGVVLMQVLTGDPDRPGDLDAVRYGSRGCDQARIGAEWRRAVAR